MIEGQDIYQTVSGYVHTSKEILDLFKIAYSLLPNSPKRDEIEKRIDAASESLKRADAALAQKLGYNTCQCIFPPSLMLWKEKQSDYVCQNIECGKTQIVKPFNRNLSSSSSEYF